MIPGVFMVAASYSEHSTTLVVLFFVFAMGFMGPYYAGVRVNPLDLSPNYAGSIMALKNGFASFCGGWAPAVAGQILETVIFFAYNDWTLRF